MRIIIALVDEHAERNVPQLADDWWVEKEAHMRIIGVLVGVICLTMGDAAQAACRTAADDYQLQRDARTRDTTPEQLEIMLTSGLLVRAAAGFKTAVEELVCRGWSQSQIDEALRRMGHPRS
ncbi:MAG TPA: hypothetical protein VHT00_07560 [Stellaceae bacterium]|nr:hypothetical protein [Stellaceae bacterium]